jgi:hypothetical protein
MAEPSIAVQIAIRSALVASASIIDMVPASRIFDRTTRPEIMPCVIVGDGHTVNESTTLSRSHVRVFADVHIWTQETGLETVKTIAGNVARALRTKPAIAGFHVVDWKVTGTRFLRDPGDYGHAIITVETLVNEVTP